MTDQYTPSGLTPEQPAQPIVPPLQPAVQPEPPAPVVPPVPQRIPGILQKILPILIVIGAIFFGAFVYYLIQKSTNKDVDPGITTVIVTPTPSPTPVRYQTSVSTSSAFVALEQSISSFSAKLNEFSKEDPSLSPPNLVLPLGL